MIFKARLPLSCCSVILKCWHLYQALVSVAFIFTFGFTVANHYNLTNIGASFYAISSVWKEEKTDMKVSVQSFNLSLFMNPGRDPLLAAITAEKADKAMNMGDEEAAVAAIAAIGNHAQSPALSYAEPSTSSTKSSLGQPFLAKLTINDFKHEKCFTTIVHIYSWSRAISPIFEEEAYVVFIFDPYTAKVRSIIIFQQLEPNITDIERLKKGTLKIGFVGKYLSVFRTCFERVPGFEKQKIKDVTISSKYKYDGKFDSINGAASFLELPDGKVFHSEYRKQFISASAPYFGGFSFAFKKGSPVASDVSRDILNLYEDGTLKSVEENRFVYSFEPSKEAWLYLHPINYWGIYLIYGAISTVCLVYFLINLIRSYCYDQDENEGNLSPC